MSDNQLKSIMERILRLHAEEEEKKTDRREVYAEAKANGYDKTALGAAIASIRKRDKVGEDALAERDAIVSLYVSAYDGSSHTYAYARTREEPNGPSPSREPSAPVTQETGDVDRSASAQSHSAQGGPAILSKAEDAGTGQAVSEGREESPIDHIGQPSGAGTGSVVRTGAPILAKPDPYDPGPIPAFLDRRIQREQAGA